jgi:hypothetical protein
MNKFIALAAAGVIAVTASFGAVVPSQAHYWGGGGGYGYGPGPVIGAGVLGFAFGAIAAGAYQNNHGWYHTGGRFYGAGWDDHVANCEDAYRSYDPRTDTYVRKVGYRYYRVQCNL